MKKFLTIATILISITGFSQSTNSNCNCLENLNHFAVKVVANYAGYQDKVTEKTIVGYNKLLDSLKTEASKIRDIRKCYNILEKYRLFFYDKHLQLNANLPAEINKNSVKTNTSETTKWNKKSITEYLKSNKTKPFEGIWQSQGYEVALLFNDKNKNYEGIIISAENKNWKEGMLKFTSKKGNDSKFVSDYLMGNFNKEKVNSKIYKNFMEFDKFGLWKKTFPITKDTISQKEYIANHEEFGKIKLRYIDDKTVYIVVKSCDLSLKPVLENIIKNNAEKLKTILNWIVDFRDNTGGDTSVYGCLLPYFYTKEMKSDGSKNWLSTENVGKWQTMLKVNRENFDKETIEYIEERIEAGLKNPNSWYDDDGESTKFDSVLPFPKKVAILSNENNGSSGETFLMVAQCLSDKVTVFGQNSAGYLDYGNLNPYEMPCENFSINIPMRRANYLDKGVSYDKNGYPPDVYIPKNNKNWIKFVKDYWREN